MDKMNYVKSICRYVISNNEFICNTSICIFKDETVYSKLNSEGNSYKTIVSTHLKIQIVKIHLMI